jgi:hypothetical protein
MFGIKNHLIIFVHNNELIWFAGRGEEQGRCLLRLPLEEVLNDDSVTDRIPKFIRGKYRSLWIVPDHWFGNERYPFQSRKTNLIEPFLERKLKAAYPEIAELKHFFTYRHTAIPGEEEGLTAYFLQDQQGYELLNALNRLNLSPRKITTPAFLWMEKLSQITSDFDQEGTLLIHICAEECFLYFYFNGNYLFSRNVILSMATDYMDGLTFEINQSLYMFSQKTKSELKRFYLLSDASYNLDALPQALGHDVIDINPLLTQLDPLENHELFRLNGVLDISLRDTFLNVSHRHVRRELEWEPVQWTGIIIGVLLLLLLIGENLVLKQMFKTETEITRSLNQNMQYSDGFTLADDERAVDQVLQAIERPQACDAIDRLLTSLPDNVRIKDLDIDLETSSELTLTALVTAMDMDHLKEILTQLTRQIRYHFKSAQNFNVGDIDVRKGASNDMNPMAPYLISFKLGLI